MTHPLGFGGLGLHSLKLEAPLIALAHHLSYRAARESLGLGNVQPTSLELQAWNQTSLVTSPTQAFKSDEGTLWTKGYKQGMRALRKELYEELAEPSAVRPTARLAATAAYDIPLPGLHPAQQLALSVAWWSHPRSQFLQDSVLIMALRDRLELKLQPVQQCEYICRQHNRRCAAFIDAEGQHAQQCCNALILGRHHAVRDVVHGWPTSWLALSAGTGSGYWLWPSGALPSTYAGV